MLDAEECVMGKSEKHSGTTPAGVLGAVTTGDQRAVHAALISRLQAATGPDRQLDIALAYVCMPLHHSSRWSQVTAPNFTWSFDAARQLLPDGYYWTAGHGKTRDDEPLGAAMIIEPGSLAEVAIAEHADFIFAFLIACLEARTLIAMTAERA